MIRRVLVIAQGPNDVGFLRGFCQLLGCKAELIDYSKNPLLRQRNNQMLRKHARVVWEVFLQENADLIVRLTDGDTNAPQKAAQQEIDMFPDEARPHLICGVCDRDIEHWVCLDPEYAGNRLGFDPAKLPKERKERSGFIKGRIKAILKMGQEYREFLADYVRAASPSTLMRWLANPAFSAFYDDCRAAASRHKCDVANLRDAREVD